MNDLIATQFFLPQIEDAKTSRGPLRPIAVVGGLLLMMMSFLTGCGGDEGGGPPAVAPVGATASLQWQPTQDPSVIAYFVHYGRQSPRQRGSCEYESSRHVTYSSATVSNLEFDTRYYFSVSAYNGRESACSNEVSTVTPPAPEQS